MAKSSQIINPTPKETKKQILFKNINKGKENSRQVTTIYSQTSSSRVNIGMAVKSPIKICGSFRLFA